VDFSGTSQRGMRRASSLIEPRNIVAPRKVSDVRPAARGVTSDRLQKIGTGVFHLGQQPLIVYYSANAQPAIYRPACRSHGTNFRRSLCRRFRHRHTDDRERRHGERWHFCGCCRVSRFHADGQYQCRLGSAGRCARHAEHILGGIRGRHRPHRLRPHRLETTPLLRPFRVQGWWRSMPALRSRRPTTPIRARPPLAVAR
jgi:hypothetical protein